MTGNGFDEYKRLYEDRFARNDQDHERIIKRLESLTDAINGLKGTMKMHAWWWGTLGATIVLLVKFVGPSLLGR